MHNRINLSSNELNTLYVSLTEINEDFHATYHSHPNLEILLFLDGSGYIQTSSKKIPVCKNDMVIINPHCKHCEISSNTLSFYAIGLNKLNIYLKETFLKKIIHFKIDKESEKTVNFLYSQIYEEALKKDSNYQILIKSYITALIAIINRDDKYLFKESNDETLSTLATDIKNIVDNYYYLNITLDQIAHRLSSSTSAICHEFKKEMGMSIIEYKLNKQFEEAINLLNISDMSISEIATATGFNNSSYFSKKFKEKYNMTPIAFKNKQK